jgi:hypothetical protein
MTRKSRLFLWLSEHAGLPAGWQLFDPLRGHRGVELHEAGAVGVLRERLEAVQSYGRNLWMSPWHENAAYLPP